MLTLESYDERTQQILEPICRNLRNIRQLLCARTGKEIKENDSVYYDSDGVVCERARDTIYSLYLGTLAEVREWCALRRGGKIAESVAEVESGNIPQILGSSDFDYIIEDDVVEEEE